MFSILRVILFVLFSTCVSLIAAQTSYYNFDAKLSESESLSKVFERSQVFDFQTRNLEKVLNNTRHIEELTFQIDDQHSWTFSLEPVKVLSDNAFIYALGENNVRSEVPAPNIKTYKGSFADGKEGQIRLTIHGDFMYAYIRDGKEEYFIEPLKYFDHAAQTGQFVLYNSKDIMPAHRSKQCFRPNIVGEEAHPEVSHGARTGQCYRVQLAIFADYSMYTDPSHAGLDAVIDHLIAVMNNVQVNYEYNGSTNFDDGVVYEISEIIVSTCAICDQISNTQNANTLLSEFSNWVDMGGFYHPFNAAHFWSNRDFIGTTVGLAYTQANLYCQSKARAVLEDWTSTASLLKTMVAHEMGHNFNGVHDGTTGMILSPTVTTTNTWSAASKSTISSQIATQAPCLTDCNTQTCSRVQNVVASNINPNGFTLDWTHSTENLYTIKIREANATNFMQEVTTINNHLDLTPPGFEICKKYDVFVYNNCGAYGLSPVQRILMQGQTSQGCAEFKPNKSVIWPGQSIAMTDQSINASSWSWDFGNGQTSTQQNPNVTFPNPGFYDVTLTVNNGVHSMVKNEVVRVLPSMSLPFTLNDGGNFENYTNYFTSDIIEGNIDVWQHGSSTYVLTTQGNAWKSLLNSDIPQITSKSGLYSPKFDFSQYAITSVSFDIGMETAYCNGPFAVQLQYSLDNGSTWIRLGSAPSFYNAGPSEFCPIAPQVFADTYGWTLNQNYVHKSIDVSFLYGQPSVIFRFVSSISGIFTGGYNIDGVLIDNFEIAAAGFTPLALDATSLKAKSVHDEVELEWTANVSSDIDQFYIQRSENGVDFVDIGDLKPTKLQTAFNYLDADPLNGLSYYRILAIDLNGKLNHSNVVKILMNSEDQLEIFPNPSRIGDNISIKKDGVNFEIATIDVFDVLGKRVLFSTTRSQNGIEISGMTTAGIYITNVSTKDGTSFSKKLIIK
jgi:PKD repeat protein